MKFKLLFSVIVCGFVAFASCSKGPLGPEPEPPTPDEEVTLADLKINTLSITPENNSRIYGAIAFAADNQGIWRGAIEHYRADLAQLKASFDVVAAKVTVGDKEQVSGETPNDFSTSVVYRLYADDGQYKEFTVALKNGTGTGLPIVAILTDGGAPIVSKEDWVAGRFVIDPQESDYEAFDGLMEIKGRGNNTWQLDKKPYAVKLAEKSALAGMKKHKRWVLLANAGDRTLMRNRVAYEIGRHTGLAWTPDTRFVEVILNGKYVGSYLLCEQIRLDENRVNIPEMSEDDVAGDAVTGGYLLEFDRYFDEVNKFRSQYCNLPVNIKEPDADVLVDAQRTYITDYVNHVEQLLYGGATVDKSYVDYIDINSFVDWWIVMELTGNRDGRLPGSCYMYKDRGGKLFAGPLWDFDLTTFMESYDFLLENYEITDFRDEHGDRSLWYKRLFSDPAFRALAKERWQSYKPAFDNIGAFIDAEIAALRPSAEVNWSLWTLSGATNQDETLSWEEAVAKMRTNYIGHLQWMDREIAKW